MDREAWRAIVCEVRKRDMTERLHMCTQDHLLELKFLGEQAQRQENEDLIMVR